MSLLLETLKVPAFCPVCKGLMKGKSTNTYYDYGACVDCFIYFIEDRVERWKSGWRPSESDLEKYREIMRK